MTNRHTFVWSVTSHGESNRMMKGDLEAIGEEYEDIQPVSKIQTQIYNLTKGTVNIMDDLDPTKFKSTYEIIQGISKVWKDISETDQAQLLETIAGRVCRYVQKCA